MSRPVWFHKLIKKLYHVRVPAAKMTRWPVVGPVVYALFFKGDATYYLPLDSVADDSATPVHAGVGGPGATTIPVHETLIEPEHTVLPSAVVDHFIERSSHRLILNECICRAAGDCQEYPVDIGCLLLGESVLEINPKMGRLVTKDEAFAHVRRARAAGLVHLIGRSRLDHIWLGAPRERLMTICSCCPCCCLWRILPHLAPNLADKVRRLPGVTVRVTEECVGCGACTRDVCFVDAIRLVDGVAQISDACRGCGRCVEVCPQGAISLTWDGDDAAAVATLSEMVEVGGEIVATETQPRP